MNRLRPKWFVLAAAVALSACATVDLPDLGQNLAGFRENIDDLDKNYMQADELQPVPTDVRSAAEWDQSAREMQQLREGFETPPYEPSLSDSEFSDRFNAAQDYADAYKDDDPQ